LYSVVSKYDLNVTRIIVKHQFQMPISFFQHAHTAEGIKIAEKRAEIILNLS
jgi:hypothetical protein